ncbi:MAG TPA: Ig-like domain-containing protein [Longimicrobium sp.]|jgi:hypothetical protein
MVKNRVWMTTFAALAMAAAGCGEAPTSPTPDGKARSGQTCTNVPGSVVINGLGGFYPAGDPGFGISAQVTDTGGCNITSSVNIQWSSNNSWVADVVGGGSGAFVYPKNPGSALIMAHASNGNGSVADYRWVDIGARRVATSIQVTPGQIRTMYGYQVLFTAKAKDQYGDEISAGSITWSTSNPSIASIQQNGMATGTGVGTVTVYASSGGLSGTASLKVDPDIYMSGPTYAYEQAVYVTGQAAPGGSYHYTWMVDRCTNTQGGCNFNDTEPPFASGMNLTTVEVGVSRHDHWVDVIVEIRQTAGGPVMSANTFTIHGAGEADTGSGCAPEVILC